MSEQSVISKKGEIEFRKKLVQHQVEDKNVFEDEFNKKDIEIILSGRMKETLDKMNRLKEHGINLSPYIEIGAERCQRSLVMENDLNSIGAACDISYDMLKSCGYYGKVFNKNKIPVRICCDANNLPFRSNSMPFVFCYETLHHFPDPTEIIKEIYRVLSPGGYFVFEEEPFKKVLHINLYESKNMYSKEMLHANIIRKALDFFFAQKNCNEVDHGIIENHEISIATWKRALSIFEKKEITVQALKKIIARLGNPIDSIPYSIAYLLGGSISGLCSKPGTGKQFSILEALICPSCRENKQESNIVQESHGFLCSNCGRKYPIVDEILFLFSLKTFEELYPEIFIKSDLARLR